MANFCGKCGAGIDPSTGRCPVCDSGKTPLSEDINTQSTVRYCPYCNSVIDLRTGKCTNPDCQTNKAVTVTPPVIKKTKKKRQRTKKEKILTVVVSVLFTVCLVISVFITVFTYGNIKRIENDTINNVFDNIEFLDIEKYLPEEFADSKTSFYDYMYRAFGISMSDRSFNRFIEEANIKDFLAGKIVELIEDYSEKGKASLTFRKSEIESLIKRNRSALDDEFGVTLSNYDVERLTNAMMDDDKYVLSVSSEDNVVLSTCIRYGFSHTAMIIFAVSCVLIIIAMIVNSPSQGSCIIGAIFTIFGLTDCIAQLVVKILSVTYYESFEAINIILAPSIPLSITLLILGITILVVRNIIINKSVNKYSE